MKATVLYVSASAKSAIISIEKNVSGVLLPVATGFVKLVEAKSVGDTIELPDSLSISTEDRIVVDSTTGEEKVFTWIKVA